MPLPLSPDTWRRLLRRVGLPDDQLAVAIVSDRRSALLYRGLAGARRAHARGPGRGARRPVAAPSPSRGRDGRLRRALPGAGGRREGAGRRGGGALVGRAGGRKPPVARGVPARPARGERGTPGPPLRLGGPTRRAPTALRARAAPDRGGAADDSLRLLAAAFDRESAWWHPEGGAFARPEVDAARVLREVRLGSDGSLAPPAARAFWEAVFEEESDTRSAEWAARVRASPPAGAAWLAERIGTGAASSRRLRLEQLTFAQRVFGEAGEGALPDVRAAVRGLRDARSVLLALERMGSRDPALFAAAAETARRAAAAPREEAAAVHGGLQGALSLDRPGPVRAHARPRGFRAPGAVALRRARGGPGTRQGTRGVGRGGAPAGARACGLRRAAARGAGDDAPARDGRPPGGTARGDRAVRVGGPVVPGRSGPRGVRAAGAGPGATRRREPGRHPARLSLGHAEEA